MTKIADAKFDSQRFSGRLAQARQTQGLNLSSRPIYFDPARHPRDAKGRWREIVGALESGERADLPDGTFVTHRGGKYETGTQGTPGHTFTTNADEAADQAFKSSRAEGTDADPTDSFQHLSPDTLDRLADHAEHGGRPLDGWESRVVSRAAKLAGDDPEDVASLLRVAAERRRGNEPLKSSDVQVASAGQAAHTFDPHKPIVHDIAESPAYDRRRQGTGFVVTSAMRPDSGRVVLARGIPNQAEARNVAALLHNGHPAYYVNDVGNHIVINNGKTYSHGPGDGGLSAASRQLAAIAAVRAKRRS